MKTKMNVKAADASRQYNQKVARGLKVKSGIKAGPAGTPIIRD
jgi:hypothetical protein